jgi:MFS family permease
MKQSPRSHIRRLALGRFISVTGGGMAYTALGYAVWERTNDFWLQALALLLTFGVTGLAGPLAGALGDRYDRRKVMAWSEGLAALAFFAMATTDQPRWLIGFAFASALLESPFWSASRASIPSLAESQDQISWANSLFGMGWSSGIALGPVIAGILLALTQPEDASLPADPSLIFALNGVSFLVSLGLTLSVRGRFSDEREPDETQEHKGLLAGVRYLAKEPVLARMMIAFVVFVLGLGMGMVADAALAESFQVRGQIPFLWFTIDGSLGFGLLIACWGTGAFAGNWAGRWLNERREVVWLVFGSAGIAVASFGVGTAPIFPLVLGSLLVFGVFDGLSIVAENGLMQRRTPDVVRSRVFAAFEALLSLGLAAAYGIAPLVLEAVGPRVTYRIAGVGALLAFVLLLPLLRLLRASVDEGERLGAGQPDPVGT